MWSIFVGLPDFRPPGHPPEPNKQQFFTNNKIILHRICSSSRIRGKDFAKLGSEAQKSLHHRTTKGTRWDLFLLVLVFLGVAIFVFGALSLRERWVKSVNVKVKNSEGGEWCCTLSRPLHPQSHLKPGKCSTTSSTRGVSMDAHHWVQTAVHSRCVDDGWKNFWLARGAPKSAILRMGGSATLSFGGF